MNHKSAVFATLILLTALLLGFGILRLTKQNFRTYEDVLIPVYNGHRYRQGSVAAQPGVRIGTPSKNTIIITVRDARDSDRDWSDLGKRMNSRLMASLRARTAESIEATTFISGNAEVMSYNTWSKSENGGEIRSTLPQIISVNWRAFYPNKTIKIHALLTRGDIEKDLRTIKDLSEKVLKANVNPGGIR